MTVKKLEDYYSKRQEMNEIDATLKDLEKGRGDELIESDVILNYQTGYPIPEKITGISTARMMTLSRKRSIYLTTYMKLQAECEEVEEYVEKIEDSELRRIVRFRFIKGLTQSQIGMKMAMDQSAVSKKIKRFLIEVENGKN